MSGYRFHEPDDYRFILSGWSASQRLTRDIPLVPMEHWAAIWHPIVDRAITHHETRIIVAHGEVQHGFLAYWDPSYVLYCYVAQPFRRRGIARGMFHAAGIDPASRFSYACRTKMSWELMVNQRKALLAHYDPFRYRFDGVDNDRNERKDRAANDNR